MNKHKRISQKENLASKITNIVGAAAILLGVFIFVYLLYKFA